MKSKKCCISMLCGMCHDTITAANHAGRHHMEKDRLPVCDSCFQKFSETVTARISCVMKMKGE